VGQLTARWSEHLKQIALAMTTTRRHMENSRRPRSATRTATVLNGGVASCRTSSRTNLYKQFNLDEPWEQPPQHAADQGHAEDLCTAGDKTKHDLPSTHYPGVGRQRAIFDLKTRPVWQIPDGTPNHAADRGAADAVLGAN